jgi:hypothetical protein
MRDATSSSPPVCGIRRREGAPADLLLVDGGPLADLGLPADATTSLVILMRKAGRAGTRCSPESVRKVSDPMDAAAVEWFGWGSGRTVGRHGRAPRNGQRARADRPEMEIVGYFNAASCRRVSSST